MTAEQWIAAVFLGCAVLVSVWMLASLASDLWVSRYYKNAFAVLGSRALHGSELDELLARDDCPLAVRSLVDAYACGSRATELVNEVIVDVSSIDEGDLIGTEGFDLEALVWKVPTRSVAGHMVATVTESAGVVDVATFGGLRRRLASGSKVRVRRISMPAVRRPGRLSTLATDAQIGVRLLTRGNRRQGRGVDRG